MKEVKEMISQRLEKLKGSFSIEWLSEFCFLMEFITNNPTTKLIVQSIAKDKQTAHESLMYNLQGLFKEGKSHLQDLLKKTRKSKISKLKTQIQTLMQTKISREKIADPFFNYENFFNNYIMNFTSLLYEIQQNDKDVIAQNHIDANGALNINQFFSTFLKYCKNDLEILSGLKTKAIWGKWDLLLQWTVWLKNGVAATNYSFKENLSNLFYSLKIADTIQSCGLFFLENLTNLQTTNIDSEICIKSIELFLDQDDQYWIILHFFGEKKEKGEFFIRKLQQESQSYALLKLLLETPPYSQIEFSKLSHTLGELELKNELKKVFFQHEKFMGSHVQLNHIDVSIDSVSILKHLSSLQKSRKYSPTFNLGNYYRFTSRV